MKDLISIISVKFSPNGQILATGGNDFQIRVCSLENDYLCQSDSTLLSYGISLKSEWELC